MNIHFKRTKMVWLLLFAFALLTPLVIISFSSSSFDSRSSARTEKLDSKFNKANLNSDNEIDLDDFRVLYDHIKNNRKDPKYYSKVADLTADNKLDLDDFHAWLALYRAFKKSKTESINTSNGKVARQIDNDKLPKQPGRDIKYLGNNKWSYAITEALGDCIRDFNVKVDTSKSPNITITIEKKQSSGVACPQDTFAKTKEGTITAPENANFTYKETVISEKVPQKASRDVKYLGSNKWGYFITEPLGDCTRDFNVKVDTSKSPNITITIEKKQTSGVACPQDAFVKTKEGTITAPENANFTYKETVISEKMPQQSSRDVKYLGSNKWSYIITEPLGGCVRNFNVIVDTSKSPSISITIERIESTGITCPQDAFVETKEGTITAPENANFTYKEITS